MRHAVECQACGYDVRASAGRCPECGSLLAPEFRAAEPPAPVGKFAVLLGVVSCISTGAPHLDGLHMLFPMSLLVWAFSTFAGVLVIGVTLKDGCSFLSTVLAIALQGAAVLMLVASD